MAAELFEDYTMDAGNHILMDILINPRDNALREMKGRFSSMKGTYPVEIEPFLKRARLYTLMLIDDSINIDKCYISALVERWRPETHTFHFPHGECTVTLEDVAVLLGLPIDGIPVAFPARFDEHNEQIQLMCETYLGRRPGRGGLKNKALSLTWLKTHFGDELRSDARHFDLQTVLEWHARGYILQIFGRLLFSGKSTSSIHYKFLYLLKDLGQIGRYSWGSGCLAFLYRALCRATRKGCKEIDGCLMLLQVWAWYRIPSIAPTPTSSSFFPLVARWVQAKHRSRDRPNTTRRYRRYRRYITRLEGIEFVWQPYRSRECRDNIPDEVYSDRDLWRATLPIICFEIVEWHPADQVMRQFGRVQGIPTTECPLLKSHNRDLRNAMDKGTWYEEHAEWINWWNRLRFDSIRNADIVTTYTPSNHYWNWYLTFAMNHDRRDRALPEHSPYAASPERQPEQGGPSSSNAGWPTWSSIRRPEQGGPSSSIDGWPIWPDNRSQQHVDPSSSNVGRTSSSDNQRMAAAQQISQVPWISAPSDNFYYQQQPQDVSYMPDFQSQYEQSHQYYVPGRMSVDVPSTYGGEAGSSRSSTQPPRYSSVSEFDSELFGSFGASNFSDLLSSFGSESFGFQPYQGAYYGQTHDLQTQATQTEAPQVEVTDDEGNWGSQQRYPDAEPPTGEWRPWNEVRRPTTRPPELRREPNRFEPSGRKPRRR